MGAGVASVTRASALHEDEVTLAGNSIVRSEITVQGSFCYTQANFTTAMRLLQDGAIPDVASWLTIRPLEEANASFLELIDAPAGTIKVILRP